jgi:guanosine-3',5'-bis(diphosphate) 3'-pyrophosphohydrolase
MDRREGPITDIARLLLALQFAAAKHRHQRRKGRRASPYVNHTIDVATVLATVGGVTDVTTLMGAVLHDTVEDTQTTLEELEAHFGREVRDLVAEVTDDQRLPREVRRRLQVECAPHISERAKLVKLADKICNARDIVQDPPADWTLERRLEYLDWTERVVAGCRGPNAALERAYDDVLSHGRALLAAEA